MDKPVIKRLTAYNATILQLTQKDNHIFCYDVEAKRAGKVRKTALKYLCPVQRSVFEELLSRGRLKRFKDELQALVECKEDALRFYLFESLQGVKEEQLLVGESMGCHVL